MRLFAFALVGVAFLLSGCGAGFCAFGNIGECPKGGSGVSATSGVKLTSNVSTVAFGGTVQFTATGGKPPYTFSISSGTGSIDANGLFTAPTGSGTSTTTVKAVDSRYTGTGDTDPSHSASLSITISSR